MGVGDHIEVWVANDIAFPEGDCRTQVPSTTEVTQAQVDALVTEFDTNMYPKESAAFSVAPDRDGTNAVVGPDANGNGGDYTGPGNKTVTLVDNVRDDNYYEFPAAPTYIAGFFSAQLNELLDRNIMTIDAFDWLHRTGANPPNEPTDDLCTSRPGRPHLYEGTFAHEYQHLLHYYTDPFEGTWINEGLSDFAQTLVGYVDPSKTVFQAGADSHIYCFQGYGTVATPYNTNPRDCGGAGNSLTLWGEDPNPNATLADYGNTYSMMQYLYDRYGLDFMSALHQDGERQGLTSLGALLEDEGADLYDVIHNFQTMNLVDKAIDKRLGVLIGANKKDVTTKSLTASVNLANPASYELPGAAPNGADYVTLQKADGTALRGRDLRSFSFEGAATLPPQPLAWTVVGDDPDRPGNSVLWSGNGNNIDAAAVTEVAVPTADPTLTLPRQVRRGGRVRLRLRVRVHRRRGHLHPDRRRQDGRRSVRPVAERHHRRVRAAQLRPVGVRRPDRAALVPVRQRRRRQRGRPAPRRHHRRRHGRQRRFQPGAVRLADRDPADRGPQLERQADRHRREARHRLAA